MTFKSVFTIQTRGLNQYFLVTVGCCSHDDPPLDSLQLSGLGMLHMWVRL